MEPERAQLDAGSASHPPMLVMDAVIEHALYEILTPVQFKTAH